MDFRAGDVQTVGLELELQLLDRHNLDLVDGVLSLLEFFPDNPYVKPESIQNTVELITPVCRSVGEMHAHLQPLLAEVAARCESLDMLLCGAGAHAFGLKLGLITPQPRYRAMEQRAGFLIHSQITFATHVHLGMRDGNEAVVLMHRLKPYLPLLIALSASSPFWRGHDTGCVSYRHRILGASRSYGVPPSFKDWAAFSRFFDTMRHAQVFESVNDIHWDIRPRPQFGSLEVRAMDAQPTVSEAMALAAFVRALVAFLREHPEHPHLPQPLPWWIEKENHYQASLQGMNAPYIYDEAGHARHLAEVWQHVATAIEPTAAALGETAYLAQLRRTVTDGLSYVRQRRVLAETGLFPAVVQSLAGELQQDCSAMPRASAQ